MNTSDPRHIVEDGYDRIAERHAAWALETRIAERARYTAVLLDRLPAGAEVLELGCGAGGPTTRALAERFRLTGVDISARSVELAREAVPGARFLHADMTKLELPAESVDGVAAFYSIIHVPREEHAGLLARIATWLRPGGILVAALGAQDTPAGYEPDWLGAPMFWSGYDADTGEAMVVGAGLRIEQVRVETADEDGQPVSFLWIVGRKPGPVAPTDPTVPRIYADFNEYIPSPRNPARKAVPLDTFGSLRDLANAGVILRDGTRLTIYADSDADEDLEGDTVVYYEPTERRWIAELDHKGHRYVPAQADPSPPFLCVRCRAPLDEVFAGRDLRWGDRCPSCGELIHRPIAPPDAG